MIKMLSAIAAALLISSFHFIISEDEVINAQIVDGVRVYEAEGNGNLYDIAVKFGVSELELQKVNFKDDSQVVNGEKLIIPASISKEEKDLLARLVHAEAKGEPYEGKVAVAHVVLNRVEDERFPDTIQSVIYEKRQFQPVDNGSINEPADNEAEKAVAEALALEDKAGESVFFFNPDLTNSTWLRGKTVTEEIGNHRFAK